MEQEIKPDIGSLKDYMNWLGNGAMSLEMYAQYKTTPDLLIAFASLFYPEFMLYDDCIFRLSLSDDNFAKIYNDWKNVLNNDRSAIEKTMNHVHVDEDFLRPLDGALSDQNLRYFSYVLTQTWGCALRAKFPDRRIRIENTLEDHGDYVITFWQERELTSENQPPITNH